MFVLAIRLSPYGHGIIVLTHHYTMNYTLLSQFFYIVEKKTLYIKIKDKEPIHQKYKANKNISKHNPNKKQKQTINKK
jgi:hypothetical protein